MNKIKTYAVGFSALAALFLVGSVMESRVARTNAATYSTPVTVLNTSAQAVPVAGSIIAAQTGPWAVSVNNANNSPVPIAGGVSAQQSGTWNVGISGTPAFTLANTLTSPGNVLSVREATRQPYQVQATVSCASPTSNFCSGATTANPVPNGFRLVINHVSVQVEADAHVTSMSVQVPNINGFGVTIFPLTVGGSPLVPPAPAGSILFVGSQSVDVVVPAGHTPTVAVQGQNAQTNFSASSYVVGFTGYLESCAIYPGGFCPAITSF